MVSQYQSTSLPEDWVNDKVCICLPTFNEQDNIRKVLLSIEKSSFGGSLFVVDGFSTDNTRKIAKGLGIPVYSRIHHGKGSAIQKGLQVAEEMQKDFLIYMDCDQTYSPDDISKFLGKLNSSDLIIGVRNLNKINPIHRRIGNVVATGLINLSLGGQIKDSISGFKCLRVDKYRSILKEDGFVADALICVLALKLNYRISLVHISYSERLVGSSKMGFLIGLREFVKLISEILKIM